MATYNQLIHKYTKEFNDKGLSANMLKAFIFELCNDNNVNLYLEMDNECLPIIEEKYEAGLVLHGTEVKSLRLGKCSIKENYPRFLILKSRSASRFVSFFAISALLSYSFFPRARPISILAFPLEK